MALDQRGYFNALRSHLNTEKYAVREVEDGRVVLKDKVYLPGAKDSIDQRVRLAVLGEALVIHLDRKNRNGNSDPLFHFLDDEAKPWSKRCDFVIFQFHRNAIRAYCIEFKSASLPESLVDQLRASEAWCRTLHSVIKHYTGEARRVGLTKYVLSCHPNPGPYLDIGGKYLQRDHTIRHYSYTEIDGMSLEDLDNTNIQLIG